MKRIVIVILSFSICLASGKLQKQMDKLIRSMQDQYQIYTPEDLHKLRSQPSASDRTNSNRDMSDIVGEWYVDHTNIGLYVTVGTDQSIPNGAALMALDTAEGSITATHNDYETELNYLLDGSFLEEEDDDDNPIGDNDNDYYRNADALTYAQDYVDENSSDYDQSTFDLETEFDLVIDGNDVSGGLGGDDPENCEINWPEDPFRMAVYSFVSEYVLEEGGSVGCFVDSDTLDQTYEEFVLDMESGWTGDDDYTVCAGMSSEDPDWVCCDCNCMDFDDMECMADDEDCLENLECGDDGDDNESSQLFIMNFDFMNFFAFIFGMDLEGVDNPLLVVFDHEEDMVLSMTPPSAFGEESPVYFAGGPDEVASSVSIDTVEQTVTFTELSLMDSTGAVVFVLDGTIGPGMIDLVADVETELPFPAIFNEQDQEEIYMTFYEDSTGIEVQIYEDYYYEETADTSDFYWYATSDSLYTINEDDYYYYEGDWDGGMYEFSGDTMVLSGEDHPCDDYYYGSMDDCMEEIAEELPMVAGLEDVDEFYAYVESILMPVSMVSISPDAGTLPEKFALYPAYPNPFNPVTTLRYDLPEGALVNITIYDMMGRQVKTLMNDQQTAGHRSLQWNATNNAGSPVSAGIYLYMIQAGEFRQTRKMVLLK